MPRFLRYYSLLLVFTILLPGCATRPPASDYPRTASYAFTDTDNTRLGKAYAAAIHRHLDESGFCILSDGPEALMMRIALIEASQRSLDMQYFSTVNDTTGKLLLQAALRAADRGVRVRLLLDDWNLEDFEAGAVALDAHRNIEIRVFNPYATRDESIFARLNFLSGIDQLTRRMHNKALIVDNQISIMGGRNLGDEYFEASKDIDFRDIDVFAAGPITRQISNNFDSYWNSDQSFPVSTLDVAARDENAIAQIQGQMKRHWQQMKNSKVGKQLRNMPLPHQIKGGFVPLIWARAELAADKPDKIETASADSTSAPGRGIKTMADGARHEFIVFSPYFVPLDKGVDWLTGLVNDGVKVRIVTNSLASTDMVPAQAGYGHYREALIKAGVELYEVKDTVPPGEKHMFRPSSQNGLHAKIYMVDRRDLAVGSFNFDPRSIHLNTEQMVIIHSSELCAKVAKVFHDITAPRSSYEVIPVEEVPVKERENVSGPLAWKTEENGKIVYEDLNPHAGFWRSVTDGFFSILPIEDEL